MELDEIARRVADEGLATRADRPGIADLHAPSAQFCDRLLEALDEQREMLAVARRGRALDQVHLLAAHIEPGATEPEIRTVGALLKPERVAVEAQRRLNVLDIDGNVVHRRWPHGAQSCPPGETAAILSAFLTLRSGREVERKNDNKQQQAADERQGGLSNSTRPSDDERRAVEAEIVALSKERGIMPGGLRFPRFWRRLRRNR